MTEETDKEKFVSAIMESDLLKLAVETTNSAIEAMNLKMLMRDLAVEIADSFVPILKKAREDEKFVADLRKKLNSSSVKFGLDIATETNNKDGK